MNTTIKINEILQEAFQGLCLAILFIALLVAFIELPLDKEEYDIRAYSLPLCPKCGSDNNHQIFTRKGCGSLARCEKCNFTTSLDSFSQTGFKHVTK